MWLLRNDGDINTTAHCKLWCTFAWADPRRGSRGWNPLKKERKKKERKKERKKKIWLKNKFGIVESKLVVIYLNECTLLSPPGHQPILNPPLTKSWVRPWFVKELSPFSFVHDWRLIKIMIDAVQVLINSLNPALKRWRANSIFPNYLGINISYSITNL